MILDFFEVATIASQVTTKWIKDNHANLSVPWIHTCGSVYFVPAHRGQSQPETKERFAGMGEDGHDLSMRGWPIEVTAWKAGLACALPTKVRDWEARPAQAQKNRKPPRWFATSLIAHCHVKLIAASTSEQCMAALQASAGQQGDLKDAAMEGLVGNEKVSAELKTALKQVLISTKDVPLTDGYKRSLRHEGHNLNVTEGALVVFATFNFADTYSSLLFQLV